MAKLQVTGRLANVKERNSDKGNFVSFGIAEPSYKKDDGTYVTPFFNFLVKADSAAAKFLKNNADKIDVVTVEAHERESKGADNKTTYFHTVRSVDVVTWKKKDDGKDETPDGNYPWSGGAANVEVAADPQIGADDLPY